MMTNDESRLWSIPAWCDAAGVSRGWYYSQPPELQPLSIKLGRTRRIRETPREYGDRIARLQAAQQSTDRAAT